MFTATFDYTFNTGSTTGSSYEMRARAYPASGTHDEDSYNVTVWSDLEDVSTPSASVSNRFEPGGSYAVSFSLTTPNSNYVITGAKVLVEGSQVAYQSFSDVTSATRFLPPVFFQLVYQHTLLLVLALIGHKT